MTIFDFFNSYFAQHHISAVYLKTDKDVYDLTFYKQEYDSKTKTYYISNRIINTDLFFRQLSKEYGVGKLQFLKQLHNISPLHKKYVSVPVGGGKYVNQYIIIKDIQTYLKSVLI